MPSFVLVYTCPAIRLGNPVRAHHPRLCLLPLIRAVISVCLLVPICPCSFVPAWLYWLALVLVTACLFICWSLFHAHPSPAAAAVVITTAPTGVGHTYVCPLSVFPTVHSHHSVTPVMVIHAVFPLIHPCLHLSFALVSIHRSPLFPLVCPHIHA